MFQSCGNGDLVQEEAQLDDVPGYLDVYSECVILDLECDNIDAGRERLLPDQSGRLGDHAGHAREHVIDEVGRIDRFDPHAEILNRLAAVEPDASATAERHAHKDAARQGHQFDTG